MAVKRTMYQRKVDVDMLNAARSVLADVLSVRPSSEQRVNTEACLERKRTQCFTTIFIGGS